jgi:hypothetical protein
MSVICYMPVICLVLGGVDRLGCMLFNAYLCNHQGSTLDAQTTCTARIGLCLLPMTLEHFFSDRHVSANPTGPH